ncbi:hypothetical protein T439DRAFT_356879 [Meredithblackwellia eburnea MCA 4105]
MVATTFRPELISSRLDLRISSAHQLVAWTLEGPSSTTYSPQGVQIQGTLTMCKDHTFKWTAPAGEVKNFWIQQVIARTGKPAHNRTTSPLSWVNSGAVSRNNGNFHFRPSAQFFKRVWKLYGPTSLSETSRANLTMCEYTVFHWRAPAGQVKNFWMWQVIERGKTARNRTTQVYSWVGDAPHNSAFGNIPFRPSAEYFKQGKISNTIAVLIGDHTNKSTNVLAYNLLPHPTLDDDCEPRVS